MSKGNNSHGGRGGRRKHNVHCVKPSDPPFLRAMKERCGYKEAADLNTKVSEYKPLRILFSLFRSKCISKVYSFELFMSINVKSL